MLLTQQKSKQVLLEIGHTSYANNEEITSLIIRSLWYLEKRNFRLLLNTLNDLSFTIFKAEDLVNTKKLLQVMTSLKISGLANKEHKTEEVELNLEADEDPFEEHQDEIDSTEEYVNPVFTGQPNNVTSFIEQTGFMYEQGKWFLYKKLAHYDNADLAALVILTLFYYQDDYLSRRDIERLSQKFVSYFPLLNTNNLWNTRWGCKTPFTCFSTRFVKHLLEQEVITHLPVAVKQSKTDPRRFKLTEEGLNMGQYIAEVTNFNVEQQKEA